MLLKRTGSLSSKPDQSKHDDNSDAANPADHTFLDKNPSIEFLNTALLIETDSHVGTAHNKELPK